MGNMTRPMTLAELVQAAVLDHREGVQGVAELLDLHPHSVYAMLSPAPIKNSTAKLGLFQWVAILKHTGDLRSLRKICEQVGQLCVPIPAKNPDQKQWLRHIAQVTREVSEAVSALAEAMSETSDGGEAISRDERKKIRAEVFEGLQALGGLFVALND